MTIGRTIAAARTLGALFALALAIPANSATESVRGKVIRTMATGDGRFGGCMAQLDIRLADQGLDCPGGRSWVTFSCTGVHNPESAGARMFESARAAFAQGRTVLVEATDEKKHNGHCYVQRIDVLGS